MDSIRGKVKEHTGGSVDVIQFGNEYQKAKYNYSFQLRTSSWCTKQIFILQISFITVVFIKF